MIFAYNDQQAQDAIPQDDRIVVYVRVNGGNDGLNTLVPLAQYSEYINARPRVGLPETGSRGLITLDSTQPDSKLLGVHPDCISLKEMYDRGWAQIVQGVSYYNTNQSHFRSIEIMHMGGGRDDVYKDGWMGRLLSSQFPTYPSGFPTASNPDPLALVMGNSVPLAFHKEGKIAHALAIKDPESYFSLVSGQTAGIPETYGSTRYDVERDYINQVALSNRVYAERLNTCYAAGANGVTYPEEYGYSSPSNVKQNELSPQLKTVEKLISGGCTTRFYMTQVNHYDTHARQVESSDPTMGIHSAIISNMFSAIQSFLEGLWNQGLGNKVIVCCYSEFGRRVADNQSYGTDHGTASPVFLFGPKVKPGITGDHPSLTDLILPSGSIASGNLKMSTDENGVEHDYRRIHRTLMRDWLGMADSGLEAAKLNSYIKQDGDTQEIQNLALLESSSGGEDPAPSPSPTPTPSDSSALATIEPSSSQVYSIMDSTPLTDLTNLRVVFLKDTYEPDLAHQTVQDLNLGSNEVSDGSYQAGGYSLDGETINGDRLDFDPLVLGASISGQRLEGFTATGIKHIVFLQTGNGNADKLVAIDTFETALDVQGVPFVVQAPGGLLNRSEAVDTTKPTATIASSESNGTTVNPIPITVNFDESVTGLQASDFSVSNGSISDFSGSGQSYSFNVIPSGNGDVTINLPSGSALDDAGNGNNAASFTISYQGADTDGPTPSVSSSNSSFSNSTSFFIDIDFDEPVFGFTIDDVVVTNATKLSFSGSDGSSAYSVEVSPELTGDINASVAEGVCQDEAGNDNLASNTLTISDNSDAGTGSDELPVSGVLYHLDSNKADSISDDGSGNVLSVESADGNGKVANAIGDTPITTGNTDDNGVNYIMSNGNGGFSMNSALDFDNSMMVKSVFLVLADVNVTDHQFHVIVSAGTKSPDTAIEPHDYSELEFRATVTKFSGNRNNDTGLAKAKRFVNGGTLTSSFGDQAFSAPPTGKFTYGLVWEGKQDVKRLLASVIDGKSPNCKVYDIVLSGTEWTQDDFDDLQAWAAAKHNL